MGPVVLFESWIALRCAGTVVSCSAGVALISASLVLRSRDSYVKAEDRVEEKQVVMYVS